MPTLRDYLVAELSQIDLLEQHFPKAGTSAETLHDRQAVIGVCFGLNAMWISRHMRYKAEGPHSRMQFLRRESSILTAMETQLFSSQAWTVRTGLHVMGGELLAQMSGPLSPSEQSVMRGRATEFKKRFGLFSADHYFERALEMHGLASESVDLDDVNRGNLDFSVEVAAIFARATSTHRYHLLVIRGSHPGSGHSVACYMSGGSLISSAHLYFFDSNWGEFKVKSNEVRGFLAQLLIFYDTTEGFGPVSSYRLRRIRMG